MAGTSASDKSKPYFPLAGLAEDYYSKDGEATASCLCGAVMLAFVSTALPSLVIDVRPPFFHFPCVKGVNTSD